MKKEIEELIKIAEHYAEYSWTISEFGERRLTTDGGKFRVLIVMHEDEMAVHLKLLGSDEDEIKINLYEGTITIPFCYDAVKIQHLSQLAKLFLLDLTRKERKTLQNRAKEWDLFENKLDKLEEIK